MTALWSSALRRLSTQIAPQNYDMWLRPIECHSIKENTIHLRVPNPYIRLWFESNYLTSVLSELRSETGNTYQFEIEVIDEGAPNPANTPPKTEIIDASDSDASIPQPKAGPKRPNSTLLVEHQEALDDAPTSLVPTFPREIGTTARTQGRSTQQPPENSLVSISLNPRYNFNSFVAGPSNQLAFAAAQSCASSYPPKYNPVFICGGVGLGKTHLLHAIGHQILKTRPTAKLCYISGERFINEFVHALRTHQMHVFRRRYREDCDVLLVDDVQFLAGKDGTQDEFFHTFNALHDSHKQIVLTADRKPYEISDIADRLRSRFAWGLLADVEPPELEVRMAILNEKAAAENIQLPDSVSLYIASSIKSNVRELEGALIRLAAYASLSRKDITLDFARETLEGSITRPQEHLTVESILKTVAGYYGIKVADIKSPRRHKSIAAPRAVAMYLARTHTKESYPDLGRAFGGKHHTTIIAAVEKITNRLPTDDSLRGEISAIESNLLR